MRKRCIFKCIQINHAIGSNDTFISTYKYFYFYLFFTAFLQNQAEIYEHLWLEQNFKEDGKEIKDNAVSGCLILFKYSGCKNAHYLHSVSALTQLSTLICLVCMIHQPLVVTA